MFNEPKFKLTLMKYYTLSRMVNRTTPAIIAEEADDSLIQYCRELLEAMIDIPQLPEHLTTAQKLMAYNQLAGQLCNLELVKIQAVLGAIHEQNIPLSDLNITFEPFSSGPETGYLCRIKVLKEKLDFVVAYYDDDKSSGPVH